MVALIDCFAYVLVGTLTARLGRNVLHEYAENQWPATYQFEGFPLMLVAFVIIGWPVFVAWHLALRPFFEVIVGRRRG